MVESIIGWIDIFPQWIQGLMGLVAAANVITAMTPTKWDNEVMNGISKVLNAVSLNVGKNKNADA